MQEQFYHTISTSGEAIFKDRGSRFLAYAGPVQDLQQIKNLIHKLKEAHPKAVHHCYAFRLGMQGETFRSVDDGEPAGSAGKPILGQIDKLKLTFTVVVVVRYFGGTLLGVPGLINAYKTAASEALEQVEIIQKPIERLMTISFPYPLMNEVMRIIKLWPVRILEQSMELFCQLRLAVPISVMQEFHGQINRLHQVEILHVDL